MRPLSPFPPLPEGFDPRSTDPQVWERLLLEEGHLGTEQEEAGLEGESGGLIVSAFCDEVDAQIADKLARAGEHQVFRGSPNTSRELYNDIQRVIEHFFQNTENLRFAIRRSCETGADTLVLYRPKEGKQYHWNMRNLLGYKRKQLIGRLFRFYGVEVTVLNDNNYTQLL